MRISQQPCPIQTMVDQNSCRMWNIAYIWVSSVITSDTRHTRELKPRIAMAKPAFNKQTLCISRLELNVRKKPVKCYSWSVALCGAETWTLGNVDQKYRESFEMRFWRRMEKISWIDRVRNEEVLHGAKEESSILHTAKGRKED